MTDAPFDAQEALPRYVRGQLSGAELERFEDLLMEHPEWLDAIEAERELARAFRPQPAHSNPAQVDEARPDKIPTRRNGYLAVAAGLLVAVGALSLLRPSASPALIAAGAVSAELRLEQFRSETAALPSVSATDDGVTLLVADVGPDAKATYCVKILTEENQSLLRVPEVKPIAGYLQLTTTALIPGTFRLQATAPGCAETLVEYTFRIEPSS